MKALNQTVKDLITLGQVAKIDVPKAARLAAIKDQSSLGKILNGPQAVMEKNLDALAKKLDLDKDGEELMDLFEKNGIFG